jgi:phenylalanyl-tRNA synthetase alpha chain
MDEKLRQLRAQFAEDLKAVSSADQLIALKDKYLRKSGLIAAEKKRVGQVAADQRAEFGQQINQLGAEVEAEIARLSERFQAEAEARALERDKIDVTLPGTRPRLGQLHPNHARSPADRRHIRLDGLHG